MAVIFTDVLTASPAWIVGLLGISAMAFLLGCAGCRQHKSRPGAERRPPPPSPEPDPHPRYQEELYPPAPPPPTDHTSPTGTGENDDYEDDFEELPTQIINEQLNKITASSAPSEKYTRVTTMGCSIESEERASLSESRCHSYENVVTVNESQSPAPVMGKDHTYLEVFPSNNDTNLELPMADEGIENVTGGAETLRGGRGHPILSVTAMRISVESEGKVSILSEGSRHSYENVANANGSPSSVASDLEGDYVNLMHE